MTNNEIIKNIARLEATIAANIWNKGYVSNCKTQIASYKEMMINDGA